MKSIREGIFESNSSSSHSLTLVRKSLYDRLANKELFYVGPFRSFSDMDETFINKIEYKPENFIRCDSFLIEQFAKYVKEKGKENFFPNGITFEIIKEFSKLDCYRSDQMEIFENFVKDVLGKEITRFEFMTGIEGYVNEEMVYDLKDNDQLIIRHIDFEC